jgi:hypothetical protein
VAAENFGAMFTCAGCGSATLLQFQKAMADWKQIQARIRRARAAADPAAKLQEIFDKTRDAMAAFELGRHLEGTGQPTEAARWYATAAERFRRADWKKKAEEAATRLNGGVMPAAFMPAQTGDALPPPAVGDEPRAPQQFMTEASVSETAASPEVTAPAQPTMHGAEESAPHRGRRRRRGKRGGRNRHGRVAAPGMQETVPVIAPPRTAEPPLERRIPSLEAPELPAEPARAIDREAISAGIRARSGDPALSSRLAQMEMQLRRLLACPPAEIESADRAPAGPGVFLVTDSDQITNYYVEACATLRIGIANLLRSSSSRRGEESLKSLFADHLGIPEARVAKYLKEHCFVRWLQLDEGANLFAHFTIAILRPVLND